MIVDEIKCVGCLKCAHICLWVQYNSVFSFIYLANHIKYGHVAILDIGLNSGQVRPQSRSCRLVKNIDVAAPDCSERPFVNTLILNVSILLIVIADLDI
jgi:Fe-S-cluster-containing dehydrogenase component